MSVHGCTAKIDIGVCANAGTWRSQPGAVEKAVAHALKNGYRHIDTATGYGAYAHICALRIAHLPSRRPGEETALVVGGKLIAIA